MEKLKICFISTNPFFLGGTTLFLHNLIQYLEKTKQGSWEFTWIYKGKENKEYEREGVNFIEIQANEPYPLNEFLLNFKILKFLKKKDYDIINSHTEGLWMNFYKKNNNQKIIHTYHGTNYYFFKNHLKRFELFKKILFFPLLIFNYFMEKSPTRKADKIICVSQKAKRQIEKLYGERKNTTVIRTGVDLKDFKIRDKNKIKEKMGLNKKNVYGLYAGRGGYWTKGLDSVVKISEEIHKLNKNYKLIVVGADLKKVKHLLDKKFIIYVKEAGRGDMPFYYNVADIFFCLSRYEGGAPTLVVSEAMASGCLVVCAKSAEQEIIEDEKNGLIIDEFREKEAKKILDILETKKKEIIKNSMETIKNISLEKWGKKYLEVLLK